MTPEERAAEARAFAQGELEQRDVDMANGDTAQRGPMLGFGISVPDAEHLTDQQIYDRYRATRDAPQAPRQLPGLAGAVGGSRELPLQSTLDAGKAQDQANYAQYAAQRDANVTPQTVPSFLKPAPPQIPDGFMIGPSGGLVPKPPPASPPEASAPTGAADAGSSQGGGQSLPAPSQGTYVPGGWTPSSRTEQVQHGITGPEVDTARAEYSAATGLGLQGVNHQVSAEQQRNDAAKAIAQQEYRATVQTQAQLADLANRKKQAGDDGYREVQGLTKEVREGTIDPNHMWAERGTAARIFSIIGVAMGAFVAAKTGGPNLVAQQVDAEIDRDIDAQKARLSGKQRSLENAKGLLSQNLARFGDMEQAILATRAMQKEAAAKEFDALTAGSKDQDLLANAAKNKAAILNSGGDDMAKLAQIAGDRVVSSEADAYKQGGYVGGDAGGGNPKDPDKLFVTTGPNGTGYRARDEKEAAAGRALVEAKENLVPILNKLSATREASNGFERGANKLGVYESNNMASIKSNQGLAALGLKNMEQGGALDKGMQELASQVTGDWTQVTGNPQAAAKELIDAINRKSISHERAQGGQGGNTGYRRDVNGNVYTRTIGDTTMASPTAGMPAMTAVDGTKIPSTARKSPQVRPRYGNGESLFADTADVPQDTKASPVSKAGIKPKHKGRH